MANLNSLPAAVLEACVSFLSPTDVDEKKLKATSRALATAVRHALTRGQWKAMYQEVRFTRRLLDTAGTSAEREQLLRVARLIKLGDYEPVDRVHVPIDDGAFQTVIVSCLAEAVDTRSLALAQKARVCISFYRSWADGAFHPEFDVFARGPLHEARQRGCLLHGVDDVLAAYCSGHWPEMDTPSNEWPPSSRTSELYVDEFSDGGAQCRDVHFMFESPVILFSGLYRMVIPGEDLRNKELFDYVPDPLPGMHGGGYWFCVPDNQRFASSGEAL